VLIAFIFGKAQMPTTRSAAKIQIENLFIKAVT